jgi:hypothetical protein
MVHLWIKALMRDRGSVPDAGLQPRLIGPYSIEDISYP